MVRTGVVRAAIVVAVAGALRIDAAVSRRAAIGIVSSAMTVGPLAARAELNKASDAAVYERAYEGTLAVTKVIERARVDDFVDGSGATCQELKTVLAIDKQAVEFETRKLEGMGKSASPADVKKVQTTQARIEAQVARLESLTNERDCKDDFDVYNRASSNDLKYFRVIERAKNGDLVSGESATCAELDALIKIDEEAVVYEKAKYRRLMSSKSVPTFAKESAGQRVIESEAAIAKQVSRLSAIKAKKGCAP